MSLRDEIAQVLAKHDLRYHVSFELSGEVTNACKSARGFMFGRTRSIDLEVKVLVSPVLPIYPSFEQDIIRQVRWGLKDVLDWLGEDVGLKPGEPTHCYLVGSTMFVSNEMYDNMHRTWISGWSVG